VLNVARYRPGESPVMHEFTLVERNRELLPTAMTVARRADWDPATRSWLLTEGRRMDGLLFTTNRRIDDTIAAYHSNITPEEINLYRSGSYVELLPTRRIDELLARPQSYGTLALLRVKHTRFTQPLVNIIILLLAIPTVLTREPTRLKAAATKCLALTGLCLVVSFLGQQMSGNPPNSSLTAQWPAIMAWLPILVFGPVAVFLLDRVET
jgi:lipopolysaccharide export LptBFGC system permease protein LptF